MNGEKRLYLNLKTFFFVPCRTDIFCDKYDPVQNTYCKRLRVLCPEHTREAKVTITSVCECPKVVFRFKSSTIFNIISKIQLYFAFQ